MPHALRITNAKIYDPASNTHGVVRDLLIENGKIVSQFSPSSAGASPQTLDAANTVLMPGAVEIHSHVASLPINTARIIQAVSGFDTIVPTPQEAGRLYSLMGYTTVIEPAVTPQGAATSHRQLDLLPHMDAGILVLMGNHEALIDRLAENDLPAAKCIVRALLHSSQAYAIKAVNPTGVAAWRRDPSCHHIDSLDSKISGTTLSPRAMISFLADIADELNLPHGLHLHGPQLGEPGNVEITAELIHAMQGKRLHLAHLQYYAYAKTNKGGFKSSPDKLLNALATNPRITVDLGMVSFGPCFTATADLPLEHALYRHVGVPGKPAHFFETANEDCFGIMPLVHAHNNPTHAIQWATGLELALLAPDPTRISLTIDHPNGGSFLNYPLLIALLMSKPMRDEQLKGAHENATKRTGLASIHREYTLSEIVTITRVAPAKALGLKNKGHLAPGADADIAIYPDKPSDPLAMFSRTIHTLKAGQFIVQNGQITSQSTRGARLIADIAADQQGQTLINQQLDRSGACTGV
jgi:formylmethanofuran dehydrogenase subunit A